MVPRARRERLVFAGRREETSSGATGASHGGSKESRWHEREAAPGNCPRALALEEEKAGCE